MPKSYYVCVEIFGRRNQLATGRNQRALAVIRALRRRQRRQNQQIEILCKDMVGAHGQFAQKLSRLTFVAGFYEKMLGCGSLETLLDKAALTIQSRISGARVAIFLIEKHGYDIHIAPSPENVLPINREDFQRWFTTQTVGNIASAGQVCTKQHLLTLGMQAPPALLKQVSMMALPLGVLGCAVGVVLVWRAAQEPIQGEQMDSLSAAAAGLRAAILAHRDPAELKSNCMNC